MGGWRKKTCCVLFVVAFLTSACAISSRKSTEVRFSEDLQADGFSIACGGDGEIAQEMTVVISDAESTERLLQWFQHRPKPSNGLGMAILSDFEKSMLRFASPLARIETARFHVDLNLFTVGLETRSSPTDAWTQVSWPIRPEDEELRDWAISKVLNNFAMERGLPPIKWEGIRRGKIDEEVEDRNPEAMVAPATPSGS
ncbi:hypothetical protein [Planctellipticum variicoloris]|uniref:hypothetical protein n=1 Tax=Planctellipticum variicoloris TaxID=3064265 RepID=UPI0030140179|nr:hypothetical protein SH412_002925 [Planctomycetaceae bacterium SH412]